MDYQVIIPAAGSGKRMKAGHNKLFLELNSKPIILHTLDVFAADPKCSGIILVIQPNEIEFYHDMLANIHYLNKLHLVNGGSERQYSVYNGLKAAKQEGIILVHDGARPFVSTETVAKLVESAANNGAAIAAVPVKDTIKKAVAFEVVETIERSSLWQVQTPQAFRFSVLLEAHERAKQDDFLGTDEASLVERIGHPVRIVESDYDNIKLTTQEDLYFAEAIFQKRELIK